MNEEDFTIPDVIDPFIGYRVWRVPKSGDIPFGSYLLSSMNRQIHSRFDRKKAFTLKSTMSPWMKWNLGGQPTEAECAVRNHLAPDSNCDCGLYAYHLQIIEVPKLWTWHRDIRHGDTILDEMVTITGAVVAWGEAEAYGNEGFRAQYAKPIAFHRWTDEEFENLIWKTKKQPLVANDIKKLIQKTAENMAKACKAELLTFEEMPKYAETVGARAPEVK